MPLAPIPSTTTFSTSAPFGKPDNPSTACTAAPTWSGKLIAASHMPSVSRRSDDVIARSLLERGLDAVGFGLGDQAIVLGVVDGLGLVDQHDRDVVLDRV